MNETRKNVCFGTRIPFFILSFIRTPEAGTAGDGWKEQRNTNTHACVSCFFQPARLLAGFLFSIHQKIPSLSRIFYKSLLRRALRTRIKLTAKSSRKKKRCRCFRIISFSNAPYNFLLQIHYDANMTNERSISTEKKPNKIKIKKQQETVFSWKIERGISDCGNHYRKTRFEVRPRG